MRNYSAELAESRILQHLKTWITESDFREIGILYSAVLYAVSLAVLHTHRSLVLVSVYWLQ